MKFTALKTELFLHHLGIESEDPKELAQFYARTMKMEIISSENKTFHCLGPNRLLIFSEGQKQKLSFAAFGCRDEYNLNQLRKRVIKLGLDLQPFRSVFLKKGSFSVFDPDNHRISFGVPYKKNCDRDFLWGPLQHLTLQSLDVSKFIDFYQNKLGFIVSDRVINEDGIVTTCFMRSNNEHHTLACFKSQNIGMDHHSYEVGDWNLIRDWCDHFSDLGIKLFWGPGRHGPGNNLFVFIQDCDGNKVELSAELEIINGRKALDWAHEARTLNLWGDALMRS
ncbi:MAG: hypothetical protein CML39_08900 [Rhodobacteraceae bacterium]|nr:MAG: hypothetical protein CML39_08900 [Paracoccaceae bacterium]